MANQKVSVMNKALAATPADLMYLIQDGISSNITVGDLFGKIPDALFSGSLQLDTLESVVANGGPISDSHIVTALSVDEVGREFILSSSTVEAPLANFMIKVVYVKTTAGGVASIRGGFVQEIQGVTLQTPASTVILMSTPLGWIVIGGCDYIVSYSNNNIPAA